MAQRPEIESGKTKLDKPFFDNAFDMIEERPTRAELSSTYARTADAGLDFMQKVRFGQSAKIGLAGDSTGNNDDEWFNLLCRRIAADYPDGRFGTVNWSDTNQVLNPLVVVQEGAAPTAGVKARDTFNRTSADLVGSTPDLAVGNWTTDGSNALGDWTVEPGAAVTTADGTRAGQFLDMGIGGDMETRIDLTVNTTKVAQPRSIRVYSSYKSNTDHLFGQITISQGSGAGLLAIVKRVGNVATKITAATDPTSTAIAADNAAAAFTARMRLEGNVATFTVTGGGKTDTLTATLTDDDLAALDGAAKGGINIGGNAPLPTRMTRFELELLNVPPVPEVVFHNTSVSGSRLEHQQARLAAMFPYRLDALVISAGHNYVQRPPEEFHGNIDAFVADFLDMWPGTPIIITGQNPQYAPSTNRLAHNERQRTLAAYARSRGFGYIPATAAFFRQSNKGRDLILPDGIHPVTGATGTGSAFWRDRAYDYFVGL